MNIELKIQPDIARLARRLKADVQGARRAGMISLTSSVESRARKDAPVRTANLANTGTSSVNADGSVGTVSFTAPYAEYVHEGTGLYGPRRQKIVPKSKKALYWPGAAHPVRAVIGMKGRPFLGRAAEELDLTALYTDGAQKFLDRQGGA